MDAVRMACLNSTVETARVLVSLLKALSSQLQREWALEMKLYAMAMGPTLPCS